MQAAKATLSRWDLRYVSQKGWSVPLKKLYISSHVNDMMKFSIELRTEEINQCTASNDRRVYLFEIEKGCRTTARHEHFESVSTTVLTLDTCKSSAKSPKRGTHCFRETHISLLCGSHSLWSSCRCARAHAILQLPPNASKRQVTDAFQTQSMMTLNIELRADHDFPIVGHMGNNIELAFKFLASLWAKE